RREAHQLLGQFDRRRMGEAGEDHVLQRARLLGQRGGDARVGMPEQVGPPRADAVEVAAAFGVVEPRAFAAHDRYERDRLVVAHLGAGMPDMLQVPRGERGIAVDEFRHPDMIVPSRRVLKRAGPVREMRLKTLKKILAAVAVLLLAATVLLWWLPVRWALPLLQPSLHGLRLQQVHGSVWNVARSRCWPRTAGTWVGCSGSCRIVPCSGGPKFSSTSTVRSSSSTASCGNCRQPRSSGAACRAG